MSPRRRCRGFTMFELMAVLVVMTVIAVAAAPGMREFVVAQRIKALATDLGADLMLARSEALKRNAITRIAPNTGGLQTGWVVSAGNMVVGWRGASADGVAVDGAPSAIQFNPAGRVAAPATQLRMTVRAQSSDSRAPARCVELDPSGRVRMQTGACP